MGSLEIPLSLDAVHVNVMGILTRASLDPVTKTQEGVSIVLTTALVMSASYVRMDSMVMPRLRAVSLALVLKMVQRAQTVTALDNALVSQESQG